MIIGVLKEIKNQEDRVSVTPGGVKTLVKQGNTVLVEKNAGIGSGYTNEEYIECGAKIKETAEEVWLNSNMVVKVKEPLESEYKYFRKDLILFTYLHLANEPALTKALVDSKCVAIAYETVRGRDNSLALLTPMSEIAGRMAVQNGSIYLQKSHGGKGVLIDGVPGVAAGHIVILGAGIVGTAALRRAVGLGARVTILDVSTARLRYLNEVFMGKIETQYSNEHNLTEVIKTADLVIGAVLIPGAKTPKLITEEMIKQMPDGGVVVDVAIDQGGCIETAHATSHDNPIFVKHGIIHYAVANIPGAVPRTSTQALTNETLSYVSKIASLGWKEALKNDKGLAQGANVIDGYITYKGVYDVFPEYNYKEIDDLLK